ncbi:MAG: hypothetical protein HY526_10985 [Betaproteobacteria bacterium]|nr:hypothetical protein [Betaproteobacteria bacterium]
MEIAHPAASKQNAPTAIPIVAVRDFVSVSGVGDGGNGAIRTGRRRKTRLMPL